MAAFSSAEFIEQATTTKNKLLRLLESRTQDHRLMLQSLGPLSGLIWAGHQQHQQLDSYDMKGVSGEHPEHLPELPQARTHFC